MGITYALLALFAWGIGDFLIQRSTRKFGDWIALFYITAFASVVLLPFIYQELPALAGETTALLLLFGAGAVITCAALFDFEALRIGKISVIEPVYALEVPITAALGMFVAQEYLSFFEGALVAVLILGIFLVATKSFHHLRYLHAERGIGYAVAATIGMGIANFLFGVGARETSPLMVNWFTSVFVALICVVYLSFARRWPEVVRDWRHHRTLIVSMSVIDNLAWICFTTAVLTIPIAIAIAISESYIALAALLGIMLNRERLARHQRYGLVIAVVAVIILALVTESI